MDGLDLLKGPARRQEELCRAGIDPSRLHLHFDHAAPCGVEESNDPGVLEQPAQGVAHLWPATGAPARQESIVLCNFGMAFDRLGLLGESQARFEAALKIAHDLKVQR